MSGKSAVLAVCCALLVLGGAAPAFAAPAPDVPSVPPGPGGGPDGGPGGPSTLVSLKLERDGRLTVREDITVPRGRTVHRTVPLRFAAGTRTDRLFRVQDVTVRGDGNSSQADDQFHLTVTGDATVRYTVLGSLVNLPGRQEVRWQPISGWDTAFRSAQVVFVAPQRPRQLRCLAGPFGSDTRCTHLEVSASGLISAAQSDLAAGERVDLTTDLPPNTAPANVIADETSWFGHAFGVNRHTGFGLLGLALALLLGGGALVYFRGRDAAVARADAGEVDVLHDDGAGGVAFSSPDGVLPGQLGTVLDEYVDVIDVTASVIDLAVRDYLWISEVPDAEHRDWWIVRRNAPDAALSGYERRLYEVLLPAGTDRVLLSELARQRPSLAGVPEQLYRDVVARGWFSRRPDTERTSFRRAGLVVAALGLVATVVLALSVGYALFGVVVLLAGLALAAAARLMPARTRRGALLHAHVRGLREYLRSVPVERIPVPNRELVFSRSLPYAVVLGETQRWVGRFAGLNPAADGAPGLYWYGDGTPTPTTDLHDFGPRFEAFVLALDGALARSAESAPSVR